MYKRRNTKRRNIKRRNKTKHNRRIQRGGEDKLNSGNDKLNPDIIMQRMLDIFKRKNNRNKAKYASVYSSPFNFSEYNILFDDGTYVIYNGPGPIDSCLRFMCFYKDGLYIVQTDGISKCGGTSSGNYILESLKLFATRYGYNKIIIPIDTSELPLDFGNTTEHIMINLSGLYLLTTGETWYNKHGFYAEIFTPEENMENKENNLRIINLSLNDWLKNVNDKDKEKRFIFHIFSKIIREMERTMDNTSIKDIFSFIKNRIRESCDKTCNIEDKLDFLEYDRLIALVCNRSNLKFGLNDLVLYV